MIATEADCFNSQKTASSPLLESDLKVPGAEPSLELEE